MPQQENLWLHGLLTTSHNKYLQIAQYPGNDAAVLFSLNTCFISHGSVFEAFTQS